MKLVMIHRGCGWDFHLKKIVQVIEACSEEPNKQIEDSVVKNGMVLSYLIQHDQMDWRSIGIQLEIAWV